PASGRVRACHLCITICAENSMRRRTWYCEGEWTGAGRRDLISLKFPVYPDRPEFAEIHCTPNTPRRPLQPEAADHGILTQIERAHHDSGELKLRDESCVGSSIRRAGRRHGYSCRAQSWGSRALCLFRWRASPDSRLSFSLGETVSLPEQRDLSET